MRHRVCMILKNICYGISCIMALARILFAEQQTVWLDRALIGAIVFFVFGFLISVVFYRCPFCHGLLPIKEKNLEFCPHCKGRLKNSNAGK